MTEAVSRQELADVASWEQVWSWAVEVIWSRLTAAMEEARRMGCDGVQFLVGKRNPIAQRAYARLGFDVCGEIEAWGEHWLCYQKRL